MPASTPSTHNGLSLTMGQGALMSCTDCST